MNNVDNEYFRLLNDVLSNGKIKRNRTVIDTIGVFGRQARFDLSENFPILTTKKIFWRGVVHELLWFLSGSTNIKYLVDNDVHIWDEWAFKKYSRDSGTQPPIMNQGIFIEALKKLPKENPFVQKWGELGEGTYGGMWRAFPYYDKTEIDPQVGYVDQISKVINTLKTNPDDRRMIVSAWHPYWVDHCALPPCHVLFHFNTEELTKEERILIQKKERPNICRVLHDEDVTAEWLDEIGIPKKRLNCLLYQRSCDLFLGVPFNISSYALLTYMVAHCVNMVPGEFIHTYGDLHLYKNHLDQVKLQLTREPMNLPTLKINSNVRDLFNITYNDIELVNYACHSTIKAEVAV